MGWRWAFAHYKFNSRFGNLLLRFFQKQTALPLPQSGGWHGGPLWSRGGFAEERKIEAK